MDKLKLDIVEISEVKCRDEQDFWSGEYRMMDTKSLNRVTGVRIVMNKKIWYRVTYHKQHSSKTSQDRYKNSPTTIVQVHMSTSWNTDKEIERVNKEIA